MTKIKMCGLNRPCDIDYANEVKPDFVGFVFAEKSKRYVSPEKALELRKNLDKSIIPVGVFVNAEKDFIARLVKNKIIDIVQLHGTEDEEYINGLRKIITVPVIQAFKVSTPEDINKAVNSTADYILLDSGSGSGKTFDHSLIQNINRPYFLAGGLTPENVGEISDRLQPYAVDASSSLETDGHKDLNKMTAFAKAVRKD
ncbi:MAG: phosphoribosylanthranilate isomerase [Prevotella sp.]|nr:phosphoribosylanthranilate isomerase [Alistipes senegalensis]MCM1357887.1 phosphoribosylanthranilate isomerase [Prevotella sp.]MCM1472952.1 phosphoribosylanthranilate isomerase [Muribaculaceae bacterium]